MRFACLVTGLVFLLTGCSADPTSETQEQNVDPSSPNARETTGETGVKPDGGGSKQAPADGKKDGDETDVDCGGSAEHARCADGKACKVAGDCTSGVCTSAKCQAPTADDGVKNGDESDVDCGGGSTGAPRCTTGRACTAHGDCESDGCGYDGKCVARRSCTAHLGGDTCGAGEVGQAGAKHETCCATAPLPYSTTRVDKYLVTAGRMRTMIDRLNGNVRGFVATLPANRWKPAWSAYVPSSRAEADEMLGPYWTGAPNDPDGNQSKRSCSAGNYTGRTYWTAPKGGDYSDFTKDQLDVKALNCVGWHLMNAFCAWDGGGRMGSRAELSLVYTNGGSTSYPWQWKDNSPFNPNVYDARLNHVFSYNFPDVPGMRKSGGDALDAAYHVSPPGRFPGGANKDGVEIAGNLLSWVSDNEYWFTWNFSWERHTDNGLQAQSWLVTAPGEPNGYYAIGGRCLHD